MTRRILSILSMCVMLAAAVAAQSSTLSDLSRDLAAIAKQASPAAVQIDARHKTPIVAELRPGQTSAFSTFKKSVGSGFVIDSNGYVLTSNDVVSGTNEFTVKFSDGSSAPGTKVGADPVTNCALIKVDKKGLKALKLGDSDALEPGMLVVTVNSQAGMSNSVSLGVVAATDRESSSAAGPVLQISGTIGPGSSGGAVLDTEGRAVGITFAMFSPTSVVAPFNMPRIFVTPSGAKDDGDAAKSYEDAMKMLKEMPVWMRGYGANIEPEQWRDLVSAAGEMASKWVDLSRTSGSSGFAIPINRIKPIIEQLKSGKTIEHAALGMRLEQRPEGIWAKPSTGSPAEKAGIKEGDIIESINGRKFATVASITAYITSLKPGDTVNLAVKRDGKDLSIAVVAGSRSDLVSATTSDMTSPAVRPQSLRKFSLSLNDAGIAEVAKALSTASGTNVIVVNPENIKGKVTVHLQSTTLDEALPLICEPLGCKFAKSGNAYTIRPGK